MRRLADDMRLIDLVVEVVDARVPQAGANSALSQIAGARPRLVVLTREDLADPSVTVGWLDHFGRSGREAIAVDAKAHAGIARLRSALVRLGGARGRARAIVLGIPNAGKSTVINALVGRGAARTEDRAGVTRAAQWFRVTPALELMDTAGILVPKIDTPAAQWKLAVVGAVPRARFDPEDVAARFHQWVLESHPQSAIPDLETFAQSRRFVRRGNVVDMHNAAWSYLKELGAAKFGRLTFEEPPGL